MLVCFCSYYCPPQGLASRVSPNETLFIPLRPPKGFAAALLDPNLLELLFRVSIIMMECLILYVCVLYNTTGNVLCGSFSPHPHINLANSGTSV